MSVFEHWDFLNEQNVLFTKHLEDNNIVQAKRILKVAWKTCPDAAELLSFRGRLLRILGHIEEGDALIQQAIDQRAKELEEVCPDVDLFTRMQLFSTIIFLGGRPDVFLVVGQQQLRMLVEQGLKPHHKLLDVGCGCFRTGHLLIPYLEQGQYFGIEPYRLRVKFGMDHVLTPASRDRNPIVRYHTDFSFSIFDAQFDFVLARSVWTHTSRSQIVTMLDQFKETTGPDGVFLTSYVPAPDESAVYLKDEWLGRSQTSEQGGFAYHSFDWIQRMAAERGLKAVELEEYQYLGQVWIRISHQ